MNRHYKTALSIATGIGIGLLIAAGISLTPFGDDRPETSVAEKKPLYWVAPMDPNYKRDEPGKSPMGMDLIPVYAEDTPSDSPGTVKITPDVVNNLGVRTTVVERAPLQSEINTVGYVHFNENRLAHIHPRVEGWIEKLHVKAEGDPVKQGQALYEIYSPALVNAQEEFILALERNNDHMIRSSEARLRALKLAESTISDLRKSRQVRQTVTFYAPQSGVLDKLNVREGFFVEPGTNLMTVANLDEVWIIAEVFERQAPLVKEDAPAVMTSDYLPGRIWSGEVDYIYPVLDEKTRTVKVRLRFDNRERTLKPNMFAQVAIQGHIADDTLRIPREALIRTGTSDRVVLALGDGRFKSIEVEAGRSDETHVEILSGLREGDEVVSSAQFLLDSESSKTLDFRRMHHEEQTEAPAQAAWVEAEVDAVLPEERQVTFTHGDIEAFGMPGMTMNFAVAENIDIKKIKAGMALHVEITRDGNYQFTVTNVHFPETNMTDEQSQPSHDHSGHH